MKQHRRDFLKTATAAAACSLMRYSRAKDASTVVTPTPEQAAWQDLELGLVYHFDLDVYMPGGHHHERSRREVLDASLYNPRKLDTDQWLEAAKAMGCRYAIFTATHHQGFLQWQSDLYPFGVKQAPWRKGKGDVVQDFVDSCRRYRIKPGIYIGIRFNAYRQVYQYKVNGGRGGDAEKQRAYMRICEKIVEELCTRYGGLVEVWFDGGVLTPEEGGPDVLPIVTHHQPDALFYHSKERADHRWAGSETGTTGYPCWSMMPSIRIQKEAHMDRKKRMQLLRHGDPGGRVWCPSWCDAPIREHDWLWIPGREHRLQPLARLVEMYYKSVGRNANLMLGAVPDGDGLIPDADFKRYAEFGGEIRRRFSRPVAETSGGGTGLILQLPEPASVNHVMLMEDITKGERIRAYQVEGLTTGNRWKTVCRGISAGHKRIHRFETVKVSRIRLNVTKSVAKPVIRKMALYHV